MTGEGLISHKNQPTNQPTLSFILPSLFPLLSLPILSLIHLPSLSLYLPFIYLHYLSLFTFSSPSFFFDIFSPLSPFSLLSPSSISFLFSFSLPLYLPFLDRLFPISFLLTFSLIQPPSSSSSLPSLFSFTFSTLYLPSLYPSSSYLLSFYLISLFFHSHNSYTQLTVFVSLPHVVQRIVSKACRPLLMSLIVNGCSIFLPLCQTKPNADT